MVDKNHFSTKVVHSGLMPDKITGAVIPPIYMTSTYVQKEPGVHQGFDYSRADNPSRQVLEQAYADLENAKYGLAFSSGLAAEQAIIQNLEPGSRILVCDDVYGGTGRLFRRLFAKYQLDFEFIDMTQDEVVKKAALKKPHLIWVETPTNPTMKVIDIKKMAKVAKDVNATLVVDNTFCSPMFQSPLSLGADIVIHSTTKYIGGHSDLIGGALMTSHQEWFEKLKFVQFAAGSIPSPMDCFLLLHSIRTLAVRMEKHAINAMEVAKFLSDHPKVSKVYFPSLPSHPQHAVYKSQCTSPSGMLSFDMKGNYSDVVSFLKNLKVFTLAESLGGVESLVNHPEKMTHASVPEDMRKKLGITSQLIRLSVGIEDASDLVADLKQALS